MPALISSRIRNSIGAFSLILMNLAVAIVLLRVLVRMVRFFLSSSF